MTEEDKILRSLGTNRRALARATAQVERLLDERNDLFEQGRGLDAPVAFLRLGEAAGCSEPAVIQALKRRERARAVVAG